MFLSQRERELNDEFEQISSEVDRKIRFVFYFVFYFVCITVCLYKSVRIAVNDSKTIVQDIITVMFKKKKRAQFEGYCG